MSTTTATAIRDRIIAVVQGTPPTLVPTLPFVAYRDEAGADFRRWARSHPGTCTRRVQVRTVSTAQTPDASNTDVESRFATFEIVVAYARRWRAGAGFDRDNTLESDQTLIERVVGRDGAVNFSLSNPNASWLSSDAPGSQTGSSFDRDEGNVDFLVIRQTMRFYMVTVGIFSSPALAGVSRDATSLKYVPDTLTEWQTALTVAGLAGRTPSYLWRCQEASSNLADSIGTVTLAAANSPGYQQSVTGWSRKAVTWSDASNKKFTNFADVPNLNANSFVLFGYFFTSNTPAANRELMGMGLATISQVKATTAQKYRVENSAAAGVNGIVNYGTDVRPLVFVYNRGATALKLYTDAEIVTAAYAGISGGGIWLGGQSTTAPDGGCLYATAWIGGASVEFTDAEVRTILQTLGWSVGW